MRRLSSNDKAPELPLPNVPSYWFRPDDPLPAAAGWNRHVWDLRGAPLEALPYSYGGNLLGYTEYTLAEHAIPGQTPRRQPLAPIVPPGTYTLALTVNGEERIARPSPSGRTREFPSPRPISTRNGNGSRRRCRR